MIKGVRRVVTGFDSNGKAVFTSDREAAGLRGNEILGTWGVDLWRLPAIPPSFSDDGTPTTQGGFPEVGSLVFRIAQLPPESTLRENPEAANRYYGREVVVDSEDFGMHRSDTIDMIVILSGEVWMKLEDSEEVLLKTGDTLIQRGTVHAWRNRSDRPCVLAAVLVGAQKEKVSPSEKVQGSRRRRAS